MKYSPLASLAALVALAPAFINAQATLYGQCGGVQWTGATTCVSGSVCTYSNPYYSQCLPGTAKPVTTTASTTKTTSTTVTTTSSSASSTPTRTKFKYFGVNESGAEFGNTAWPGVLNKDYTWPATTSIDYFVGKGFNTFRVCFLMERISPPATGLTGAFDPTYLAGLTTIVNYITSKGGYAVVDPHNFMIYDNAPISNTATFQTWWTNLATVFKSNPNVIFDCMNEPNGIPAATTFSLMQAAVNGIRAAGATTQLILVEGTSWTGAWTWVSSGNSAVFGSIVDPNNNIAIEMHQYLDSDGSGTNGTCVSATIGAERLAVATSWLQANGLKGFLGEMGAGNNSVCISAVYGALESMQESGAWIGALWWAAGPWWGDAYFTGIEPPTGAAIANLLPQALEPFL
ncbi:glycoside hydrolase family 5 protein [Athelia psychrophila]|uniref:cellulase n=1 Tax=Athelia psychrophila TaxID=1759441 RepID=A0A166E1G3_9AGAM|nr:glycoside hydrolase family 5 protein [Fibularhizoctonia sp. CBS 109695]